MPYIITTRTRVPLGEGFAEGLSRQAVATLDEALEAAYDRMQVEGGAPAIRSRETYEQLVDQWEAIDESGGTVGPLPDGTVIEVEQVSWNTLAVEAGFDSADPMYHDAILAAANGYRGQSVKEEQ